MVRTTTRPTGIRQARRNWTEAKAREVFAELRASGESLAKFARRKEIPPQRLSYWSKRLTPLASRFSAFFPARNGMPETKFVAVALPAPLAATSPAWIELAVGPAVVRMREGLDVDHVARLVEAIARRVGGPC